MLCMHIIHNLWKMSEEKLVGAARSAMLELRPDLQIETKTLALKLLAADTATSKACLGDRLILIFSPPLLPDYSGCRTFPVLFSSLLSL